MIVDLWNKIVKAVQSSSKTQAKAGGVALFLFIWIIYMLTSKNSPYSKRNHRQRHQRPQPHRTDNEMNNNNQTGQRSITNINTNNKSNSNNNHNNNEKCSNNYSYNKDAGHTPFRSGHNGDIDIDDDEQTEIILSNNRWNLEGVPTKGGPINDNNNNNTNSNNNSDSKNNNDIAGSTNDDNLNSNKMAGARVHSHVHHDLDGKQSNNGTKMGGFNPSQIISDSKNKSNEELPQVEQLGTITVNQLNEYNCDANRQCISLFGTIYDVTNAKDKYGSDGSYKSFAGHDITLMLGAGKMEDKWLDRFVKFTEKQMKSAQSWVDLYEGKYPKCGRLDVWDTDQSQWPKLTPQEEEDINQECIIM